MGFMALKVIPGRSVPSAAVGLKQVTLHSYMLSAVTQPQSQVTEISLRSQSQPLPVSCFLRHYVAVKENSCSGGTSSTHHPQNPKQRADVPLNLIPAD